MNRGLLNLINGFNALQKDRDAIQATLDSEVKAQKMCLTQLRGLERKMSEKMERRDEMLTKYKLEFADELAKFPKSFIVFDEVWSANFECKLFGKSYVMFYVGNLSEEALNSYGKLVEEVADTVVAQKIDMSEPYNSNVDALLKLDKEIKKNPTVAKEKLIAREVGVREESIKNQIKETKQEIIQDEELLAYYKSQLIDKAPVKNNLINRIIKRKQVKAQEAVQNLTRSVSLGYAKVEGYNEQLADTETIKAEAKAYVAQQLESLSTHMALLENLDSIKGRLESYSRRYVAPVLEQINQQKTALKSSNTMQELHKADLKRNAEELDDFLISRYQDQALVNKLLTISKKDCTPEQWRTIALIRNHYNENVAKNLNDLLV